MNITTSSIETDFQRETLQKMPARPINDLLGDIIKIGKLFKLGLDVDVPFTTFHLKSGRDLSGRLIDLDLKTGMLLIYNRKMSEKNTDKTLFDSTYLNVETIEAITLHNSSLVAHLTSSGNISSPTEASPLSIKEITSKLEKFSIFFKEEMDQDFDFLIDLNNINEDSIECMSLMELIRNSLIAIHTLISKSSKKICFNKVLFKNLNFFNITLKDKTLVIGSPLAEIKKEWNCPNDILKMIAQKM